MEINKFKEKRTNYRRIEDYNKAFYRSAIISLTLALIFLSGVLLSIYAQNTCPGFSIASIKKS